MTTVYIAIFRSLAAIIHQVSNEQLVYAIFAVGTSIDSASGAFLGLLFVGGASILDRRGVSPRWLTRLGLVGGAVVTISGFGLVAPER